MSSARTIVKNTGFLFSTEIFDKIASFFLVIIITRYLGNIGFGKYSFAFAFVGLFVILSDMGLSVYTFKEISKDNSKTKKLIDNVMSLILIASLFVFLIATLLAIFLPNTKEVIGVILLVELHELFHIFITLNRTVFNSYERNEFKLYSIIIEKGLSLGFGAYVLTQGYGLIELLLVLILAKIITLAYCYVTSYKKFVAIGFATDTQLWKKIIKNSIPFWFSLIFLKIFYRIDTVMLTTMKGYATTGWYNAASTLTSALAFIPGVVINATFPAMSKFFHTNSRDLLKILYKKTFYYLLIIGLPITSGIFILSQRLIIFIYGNKFTESGVVLKILSLSLFFIFLNLLMGYLLNAINKQHLFTLSNGLCVGFNVIMNLMLIPKFSHAGAAFSTFITQIINFLLLYYFTTKNGYFINIIMSLIILKLNFIPLLYIIPLSAASYFMLLFLMKGFGKDEFMLIRSLLNKNK